MQCAVVHEVCDYFLIQLLSVSAYVCKVLLIKNMHEIKITVCACTANRSCLNLPFLNAFISIQPYIHSFVHSFTSTKKTVVVHCMKMHCVSYFTFAFHSKFPFKIITCAIDAEEK